MEQRIMSKISDSKLHAFSIGSMGKKGQSKKELDELKKKEEEKAAAQVFEDFVATFETDAAQSGNKVWIKAGVYDAGRRSEDVREKGALYKPSSKLTEMLSK